MVIDFGMTKVEVWVVKLKLSLWQDMKTEPRSCRSEGIVVPLLLPHRSRYGCGARWHFVVGG